MAGRIHFSLFILLSLVEMALPFAFNAELKSDMKDSINQFKSIKSTIFPIEEQKAFAQKYFAGMLNKKIPIQNFNYYSAHDNEIFILYEGYGSTYADTTLWSDLEQPELTHLYQFNPGDEVVVKGYKIKKGDDYSLYAKNVLVQIQHESRNLFIPIELFEKEILNPQKKEELIRKINFPMDKNTFCENIFPKSTERIKTAYPSDKNEAYKILKSKYDYAKANDPNLRNMGELYLNNENKYCFDMIATNVEEFYSIKINQQFIFKPYYK